MIQDDYRDEEHDVDDDTVEREHTKEHYTWLVETLLNGLKEHASFEEKYPDIAAPVEMQTIRDEMERALLEGMRLLYCSEQVELLDTMVEESGASDGLLSDRIAQPGAIRNGSINPLRRTAKGGKGA